ncbi:MAG: M48 family metallopeptidase [Bacteroidales bacterium]|jgi:predicted metal-dependent hydrolase|nr:M48 family metallopeptidase [Bacteroidales bacterium]
MTNKTVKLKDIGSVTFSGNIRSRNIKISVKPDKSVLVSFPYYASFKSVTEFVERNKAWILRQQSKFENRLNIFSDNSVFKTKHFTVNFSNGFENKAERKEDRVFVTVKDFSSAESYAFIEKVITGIYRLEAINILPARLNKLAGQFGFSFNNVTVRNNKHNWGSCSSRNNISLNLQMMKMPDELIDYILLHELVHTKIKNHGPVFWEKLNEITGNNARALAKKTKQYSVYL